jgi:hypothetical protein
LKLIDETKQKTKKKKKKKNELYERIDFYVYLFIYLYLYILFSFSQSINHSQAKQLERAKHENIQTRSHHHGKLDEFSQNINKACAIAKNSPPRLAATFAHAQRLDVDAAKFSSLSQFHRVGATHGAIGGEARRDEFVRLESARRRRRGTGAARQSICRIAHEQIERKGKLYLCETGDDFFWCALVRGRG